MINRNIIWKNMISVSDTKMRIILKNMMNYIYGVEWLYIAVKEQIENPEAVKATVNEIQGQFAQKMIDMNNIINKKFADMDAMIKSRLEAMENTIWTLKRWDDSELKEQIEQLTKLVISMEDKRKTPVAMTVSNSKPSKKEKTVKEKPVKEKKKNKRK